MASNSHNPALGGLDMTPELLDLFNDLPGVMFCVKDQGGRYAAVNEAFVRRSSASTQHEALGRTARELFVPDLAERYEAQDSEVLATGKPLRGELEIIRATDDGEPGWYLTTKLPLVRDTGAGRVVVAVLAMSTDLRSSGTGDGGVAGLARVVELVRERLEATPPIVPTNAELAAAAGTSVSTLDRHMRKVFSLSPRAYILKQRMDRAMVLLAETDLPIAEIAHRAGFYDQPNFTRQLARLIGETPAGFRRRARTARR
ncbi:MAG: AraC family transcriptional regulator [Bifidobacteriaceae bacterium]|jgi:AraC-like DNA-binding protein|nr:AraC family transcriptional regulator [Bifidobacteriaceae bacterium]